jgi:N,N-dimethylformamidase
MSDSEPNPMPVVGYANRLSVQPGETIEFKTSCDFPVYRADIVRLRHASSSPKGPGFKESVIQAAIAGEYPGKKQNFPLGSYVMVQIEGKPILIDSFSVQAWVLPSAPRRSQQCVLSWRSGTGPGSFGIFLNPEGELELRIVDEAGKGASIRSETSMRASEWYFVAIAFDAGTRNCALLQIPLTRWPDDATSKRLEGRLEVGKLGALDGSLVIGATWDGEMATGRADAHFNGKIDRPTVFSRALTMEELESLMLGMTPNAYEEDLMAVWDFSVDIQSRRVADASGHELHGYTVNNPKRAVTGHNWTGREVDFRKAPDQYGAIYFHEDDLEDAKWETGFELRIPENFRSGVYAARLQSGGYKDYVPFFVRPKVNGPKSKIAFLVPTLSYMAYANFHAVDNATSKEWLDRGFKYPVKPIDKYLVRTNLTGFYDLHVDHSGVNFVSRLMPLLDIRPDFEDPLLNNGKGGMHQFPVDTCLVDWLEAKGFEYDVITDEDLHHEGVDLLKPYRVVLTGSHPEYYTENMLDALQAYLNGGGRLMYLGGNGFYWVTSIDPERPHIAELRRWGGTSGWKSDPGEYYHNTTGEMGGTWRNRGRAPQKLVGVGFTSQGIDRNRPYNRMPESFDPKVAFIFEGIGKDELIGDFENPVLNRGAAGFEVDRLDFGLGTPPNAKLLATSTRFADSYLRAIDELDTMDVQQTGSVNPKVRADMVLVDYPNGGAVFSVGSISWCGCLPQNTYDNNVSRITGNVLSRFASHREPG